MKIRVTGTKCDRCRLATGARSVCIGGNGSEKGGILFVGEAPGKEEDARNSAFQGPTGKVLRNLVAKVLAGYPVRFTNSVRCFPKNADVRKSIVACNVHLWEEIERVQPNRIVALGATAFRALVGEELPITQLVGGWTVVDKRPYDDQEALTRPYLVQFAMHPSAQLHNRALVPYWHSTTAQLLLVPPPADWLPLSGVREEVVNDIEEAVAVLGRIRQGPSKFVSLDTEYNNVTNRLLCLGLATSPNVGTVFPDHVLRHRRVIGALEETLLQKRFCAHNWKFDAHVLVRALGVRDSVMTRENGWWIDTSVLRKISHPEQDSKLELAAWMVGLGGHKAELYELLGKSRVAVGKGRDETWGPAFERTYDAHPEVVMRYNALDTVASWRLAVYYATELRREGYWSQWEEVFGPLGGALFTMEQTGLLIDVAALDALGERLNAGMEQQVTAIRADPVVRRVCASWDLETKADDFNPKSPDQMRQLLFDSPQGLQLKVLSKTDGGLASTNKHTLKEYQETYPVLERVAEFNRLKHKYGTYVKGYRKRLVENSRIHTSYRQDVARTGRLASRDPNVHNIPNRGREEDKALRQMFLPDNPDRESILEVDYSQIELRVAADLSADPVMLECFLNGIDIHCRTAANILGCDVSAVSPEQRQKAKPINFGSIFLQSARGLKDNAKKEYGVTLTQGEAEAWKKGFFKLYRGYRVWTIKEISAAKRRGCAYVYWEGKPYSRRWLAALGGRAREKGEAERQSVNTPIQGGASLYNTKSIVRIQQMLREGSLPHVRKILNTVHDSIWFSVDKGWEQYALERIGRVMVSWPTLRVPLEVEGKFGPTLGSLAKLGTISSLDRTKKPYKVYFRRAA